MSRTEREHPRYAHEAAVKLILGKRTVEGRTRNVSRGGLCAELAEPLPVGSDLDVEMVLVFEDDVRSEALRLPGRVVWCTTVDDSNQVGIAFRPLDAQRLRFLTLFLSYLDDARLERRARNDNIDDRFR
ncbi:MAG TPA: PilZ domain-containing protein [Kofleriaceae bacterium]|nr:PilZ domain-containing protein [Kofleriaceae bacterium]